MNYKSLALFATALLAGMQAHARANDFPTQDRVEYVLECARNAPASATAGAEEYIYKCSCVIDAIAQKMSYEQYVEFSTAAKAISIGGERGETMRAYTQGKAMAKQYRAIEADARKACFIH